MIHAVYVVTTGSDRVYADVAAVSMMLLRMTHPDCRISVACDELNAGPPLRRDQIRLLDLADDLVVIRTGVDGPVERSRCLKTLLRSHVDGDFLYLDADTLAVRPLDAVFEIDCDVAAARTNTSRTLVERQRLYRQSGFGTPSDEYFNSGVIFCRDTVAAHRFFDRWHSSWRMSLKCGSHLDQPAFNFAVQKTQMKFAVLPYRYNAVLGLSPWNARGAAILHFCLSNHASEDAQPSILDRLVRHYQETGRLDEQTAHQFQVSRNPWMGQDWVTAHVATGNYFEAARLVFQKLVSPKPITTHATS